MSASVTSTQTNPQSLLSRISPLRANVPTNGPRIMALGKRNLPSEENERSNERSSKRRRSDNEHEISHNNNFAPWLKASSSASTGNTREERLHSELLQFVEYISPSKQEREARNTLVSRIEGLLQARWYDAQVTVFGSSATGLGLFGGDIDLVVSFNDCLMMSDWEKKRRLAAMGDVLRKSGMTTWVNRIFGARVPIIAFSTTEELGEISIDISIRNEEEAGVRAIPLVKQYLAEMPALRPLILAVKAFLSFRDLNDLSQGTLSSYAITLMCISFLQRNPTGLRKEQLDDPCTEKSFGLLLMDFFHYYGHDFPYWTHYISVSDGGIFPKQSKSWEPKKNDPAVLAIQCMLNPENNITRGCKKIGMIVEAFKEALDVLQSTPLDVSSDRSSLCRIYEIAPEDDARRHLLDESVDSGSFARAAASCSRPVSGRVICGVPPSGHADTRNNGNRNEHGLLARLERGSQGQITRNRHSGGTVNDGLNSNQNVQHLPVLRWGDGRSEHLYGTHPSSYHFNFQPHGQHFQNFQPNYGQGGSALGHERYPSPHSIPNYGGHNNRNFNNLSHAIRNHLAPQNSRRTGRPYNSRY